jgi:hypothetical protein
MSDSAPYLNAVDACRHVTHERLTAAYATDDPDLRAKLLRRAAEFALRSVLTAWDAPAAKADKLWAAFDQAIGTLLPSDTASWAQGVRVGSSTATRCSPGTAEAHIGVILALTDRDPPDD